MSYGECSYHEVRIGANESRNINIDLTQHRNTGYFTQAMSEVYEKCQEDRGLPNIIPGFVCEC